MPALHTELRNMVAVGVDGRGCRESNGHGKEKENKN